VLKDTSSEELVKAVQQVSAGMPFLSGELAVKVALTRTNVPANPLAELTPRELQVLALLADGKPYETIADELAVSYKTVVNTSSQLKHKLKVRTLPQLIRIAVQLLAPPA
jgi:two-component system, NarL family, invasion response regulator UvrY